MIKKENLEKTSAWPFVEAKKMLRERKSFIEKKGKITLQTGYGPSGLPHIGTFAEVARTSMLVNALSQLSNLPTEIITFSDDMDGLRKVPDNVPNHKLLSDNLHKPLTQVPDPFEKFDSFGEHNNEMLKNFLDSFKFKYNFQSSTTLYKNGFFNPTLKIILENYEGIMNIIIPTLGKERQQTYSPFLPICPDTGVVLQVPIEKIDRERESVFYRNEDNELVEVLVTGGHCKLQWKPDFGMRWAALDVDYEMYGKDHRPNAEIYSKICQILGGTPPVQFFYELFLDEEGAKISKSKGNSISVDEWMHYAPIESMSLFMFQSPTKAKRLHFDVLPKSVDEYLTFNKKYHEEDIEKQLVNPVFHIHHGNVPTIDTYGISFSLLSHST